MIRASAQVVGKLISVAGARCAGSATGAVERLAQSYVHRIGCGMIRGRVRRLMCWAGYHKFESVIRANCFVKLELAHDRCGSCGLNSYYITEPSGEKRVEITYSHYRDLMRNLGHSVQHRM